MPWVFAWVTGTSGTGSSPLKALGTAWCRGSGAVPPDSGPSSEPGRSKGNGTMGWLRLGCASLTLTLPRISPVNWSNMCTRSSLHTPGTAQVIALIQE